MDAAWAEDEERPPSSTDVSADDAPPVFSSEQMMRQTFPMRMPCALPEWI